jgi:hypothetical protein
MVQEKIVWLKGLKHFFLHQVNNICHCEFSPKYFDICCQTFNSKIFQGSYQALCFTILKVLNNSRT